MVKFIWHEAPIPKDMPITQVYGVLFTDDGRIMLRVDKGFHGLVGGTPEPNETHEETLHREVYEEVNCEISDLHYLGYQTVIGDGEPYAQLRYIAKLTKIGKNRPDLDGGKMCERILVPAEEAGDILDYGEEGKKIIAAAIKLAKAQKILPKN
ncbi:MAG: NUDIX domain-containing protein [Candidatus Saccharibacteria bacterium]|jgi:8-oxo-dGTP pyrophosphatase MutT (NUDIX family)|nr:NUDIX domain-containing protein [Candidatus Saccharibacteria bacterium]